jgi:hypothetical protein
MSEKKNHTDSIPLTNTEVFKVLINRERPMNKITEQFKKYLEIVPKSEEALVNRTI